MSTLLLINGESVELSAALRQALLHNDNFLSNTIDNSLIRQYAEQNNIRNTDDELQLAADELRYSRGLEKVEAATQWMAENHQTLLSVQDSVDFMLLRNKVRNSFSAAQIEGYYAEHQLELETVSLYSIRVDSESKAQELLAQINEEGANFHVLAMEHSEDAASAPLGGHAGNLSRSEVTGAVEAAAFNAKPGAVVGPVKTDKGWNLFKVAAINKPTVEAVKSEIQIKLMDELLKKLRAEASVQYAVFTDAAGA